MNVREVKNMRKEFVEILSRYMGLDIEDVEPNMLIARYCDEIGIAEIALALEEEYGTEIPSEVLEGSLTVGELWAYIKEEK